MRAIEHANSQRLRAHLLATLQQERGFGQVCKVQGRQLKPKVYLVQVVGPTGDVSGRISFCPRHALVLPQIADKVVLYAAANTVYEGYGIMKDEKPKTKS